MNFNRYEVCTPGAWQPFRVFVFKTVWAELLHCLSNSYFDGERKVM